MLFFFISEDLHLRSNRRDELLALLTLRFANFNRNTTLKIYSVTTNELIRYNIHNSSQNKIAGIFDIPPDEARLRDQEIKGEDEYNEEMQKSGSGATPDPDGP